MLMGTSTGYLGNVGDIDAHVVGYAGCALGILMLFKDRQVPERHLRDGRRPILLGLGMFLFEGSLQLGAPLLAFWAMLLSRDVVRAERSRRTHVFAAAPRIMTVFGLAILCWSIIARVGSDGSYEVHNEAWARAIEATSNPVGLVATFPFKAIGVLGQVLDLFRWWLVAASVLGWVLASWEVRYWTGCWLALVIGATVLTRYTPSTVFFVFPAIYVLASAAAGRLAEVAFISIPRSMFGSYGAVVVAGLSVLTVSLVPALTQLGFLWGDYTMPAVWWPGP
jgi:hypothetical protein